MQPLRTTPTTMGTSCGTGRTMRFGLPNNASGFNQRRGLNWPATERTIRIPPEKSIAFTRSGTSTESNVASDANVRSATTLCSVAASTNADWGALPTMRAPSTAPPVETNTASTSPPNRTMTLDARIMPRLTGRENRKMAVCSARSPATALPSNTTARMAPTCCRFLLNHWEYRYAFTLLKSGISFLIRSAYSGGICAMPGMPPSRKRYAMETANPIIDSNTHPTMIFKRFSRSSFHINAFTSRLHKPHEDLIERQRLHVEHSAPGISKRCTGLFLIGKHLDVPGVLVESPLTLNSNVLHVARAVPRPKPDRVGPIPCLDGFHLVLEDRVTVAHERHRITDLLDLAQNVRREEDRQVATGCLVCQHAQEMRPDHGVQTIGGLIEDEQFRFRRESDVEPKQLAHALGICSNLARKRQFEDGLQPPHILLHRAAVQSRVELQNLEARHV